MEQSTYTIQFNTPIGYDSWRLDLVGDVVPVTRPGQFVNLKLNGFFLRRPFSVYDWDDEGDMSLIYKAVGVGTEAMTKLIAGQRLDVLTGLGNGFDIDKAGPRPLLIGGGAGVPPLYGLAKALLKACPERQVQVLLGFNRRRDVILTNAFHALGAEVYLITADDPPGERGVVTDVLPSLSYSYFYACGPTPMLRAVEEATTSDGQLSLEARMGCGFGACMGCSCQTVHGPARVCKEGPVFEKGEILW